MKAAAPAERKAMVSVVLVNYNTAALTCRCLESLTRHCGAAHEIILVDNASRDDSITLISQRFPDVRLLANPTNLGFGPAINQGAALARGRYLFLLNTDTELRGDTPGRLADFLEEHPEIGAAGCKLTGPDGAVQPSAARFPTLLRVAAGREVTVGALQQHFPSLANRLTFFYPPKQLTRPSRVDWCVGAALMLRKAAFDAIGGFDPRIFLYGEEIDLCLRLALAGWPTYFYPLTTVIHFGGASSDGELSPRRLALVAAGHRYFYHKHWGLLKGTLFCLVELTAAVVKGAIWQLAALMTTGPDRSRYRDKAYWHFTYLKHYFSHEY